MISMPAPPMPPSLRIASPTPLSTCSSRGRAGAGIARDAEGFDHPHIQFARHDRRRHQTAAGDADDRRERPGLGQPPGERARIAMELIPGNRKRFCDGCAIVPAYVMSQHERELRGQSLAALANAHQQSALEQAVARIGRLVREIELRRQQRATRAPPPLHGSGGCGRDRARA